MAATRGGIARRRGGAVTRIDINVGIEVKRVHVYDDINILWHPSAEQRIALETGENLVDEILFDVVGDSTLEVYNNNSCKFTRSSRNVTVHIYSNEINYLEKFGYGEVNGTEELILDHRIDLVTRGSGNVNLAINSTREVFIAMRSLSNITLVGEALELHVFLDGRVDGKLDASDFTVEGANIVHAGSNDVMIFPLAWLRGTLTGFGNVLLFNNAPFVAVDEQGAGRVIRKY